MNINNICIIDKGTRPKKLPINVKGTNTANKLNRIDEAYTIFEALLCINGTFEVLMMCKPIKFDTTPYENHIVWNVAASSVLSPNINHSEANISKSKNELNGPIINMKRFKLLRFQVRGLDVYSLSTLSNGKVICPTS